MVAWFPEKPQAIIKNVFWRFSLDSVVTIGICVKNGSDTILGALESVMAQSFPHEQMEVIVVDDGSEDDTLSIVHGYASKMDMPMKILHYAWKVSVNQETRWPKTPWANTLFGLIAT